MTAKSHQPGRGHGRAQSDTSHRHHGNESQASFAQRAAAAQSRFLEGSMNDRVSAVPPPDFLGPDDATAYENQFYKPGANPNRVSAPVPTSSYGNRHSVQSAVSNAISDASKRSFFAPLWDGIRSLGRTRSASTIRDGTQRYSSTSASSVDDGSLPREGQGVKRAATEADRPTRDEVMANYRQLVDSGFFSSHAIQSTRHAFPAPPVPPPSHAPPPVPTRKPVPSAKPPTSESTSAPPAPSHAPPPPPSANPTSPTFSLFPRTSSEFKNPPAIPRQPRQHAPPPVSFTPLPTIPSVSANIHQGQNALSSSPARGTKRARSSADDDTAGTTATGARKLVKKLRKSTSRFGSDLRGSKANAATTTPPLSSAPTTESTDVEMTGTGSGMNRLRRSFSSSLRPEAKPKAPPVEARPRSSAGKLLKRRIRPGSSSAQDSNVLSSPTNYHPQTFLSPPSVDPSPRPSYDSSASSAMSPSSAAAFHYPSRTRARRVSVDEKEAPRALRTVQPDANRGVPDVPAIPAGMFKFGVGEDVENRRSGRLVR